MSESEDTTSANGTANDQAQVEPGPGQALASTSRDAATEARPTKPTAMDVLLIIILLMSTTFTAYTCVTFQRPLFGRTVDSMYLNLGNLASLVFWTILLDGFQDKSGIRYLMDLPFFQMFSVLAARPIGSFLASRSTNPTATAFNLNLFLNPGIGLAGSIWIKWVNTFMEPEATEMGKWVVLTFMCVALATFFNFATGICEVFASLGTFDPSRNMQYIIMHTLPLAITICHFYDRPIQLKKSLIASVLFFLTFTVSLPPYTPPTLVVRHQEWTPEGILQVFEDRSKVAPDLLLRLNTDILGTAHLTSNGSLSDSVRPVDTLISNVRLTQGLEGNNALVLGLSDGQSIKSLVSNAFQTTLVDTRQPVIEAAQTFFEVPRSIAIVSSDPWEWVQQDPPAAGYGIVIHDLFDSGELPARFYTTEFWTSIKTLMNQNAILAVKVTAKPASLTTKSTINTLRKSFESCRVFHGNSLDAPPLDTPDELADLVVFCSLKGSVVFKAEKSKFVPFFSRDASSISTLEKREVDITAVLGSTGPVRFILTENDPVISRWGKEGIVDFWKLMRQRYPSYIWHSY